VAVNRAEEGGFLLGGDACGRDIGAEKVSGTDNSSK
jgi:hypothetical protein